MSQKLTQDVKGRPPLHVSRAIVGAISQALREEKLAPSKRWAKTFSRSLVTFVLSMAPVVALFGSELDAGFFVAAFFWWVSLFTGFALYYKPEPRLPVPGMWDSWVFAKILITMSLVSILGLLICPSFAFSHQPLLSEVFLPLTDWFMRMGGMKTCMLGCGILFSGLGAIVSFSLISRILVRSRLKDVLRATLVAYAGHAPLIFLQVWDEGLRNFIPFWILGSFFGVLVVALGSYFFVNHIQEA